MLGLQNPDVRQSQYPTLVISHSVWVVKKQNKTKQKTPHISEVTGIQDKHFSSVTKKIKPSTFKINTVNHFVSMKVSFQQEKNNPFQQYKTAAFSRLR